MLDLGNERELGEELWHALPSRTQLPKALRDAFRKHAGEGIMATCQRRYARMPLHNIAIAANGGVQHACFTKDVSRIGIGFYAPVNLLPKKVLQLWLPSGKVMPLRVTRCRRLDANCYEVGTVYHLGAE